MLVREYMTPDPIVVEEELSVLEAARLMKGRKVRRFPVVRDGKLVGIVTDRDLRSAAPSQVVSIDASERELMPELHSLFSKIKIKDIMARSVRTIGPENSLVAAAFLMLKHRISGMPVVDSSERLVGIITESDIFRVLVDFSGIEQGKTVFGFRLEDRPGSIREVADIIREHGGRLASIFTAYDPADLKFRRVYIRIEDLPTGKLEGLKEALEAKAQILYVLQDEPLGS